MSFLHALDAIFIKLSTVPGLGFLHEYVHELETQKFRREKMITGYRGYAQAVREAGKEAKHFGHHGHDEHAEHEDHGGHEKEVKRGRRASPRARPGTGGLARKAHEREDIDSDGDLYEDDDFESYLQH